MTLLLIPKLLSSMYLYGLGSASAMIAFKPWILISSIVFGAAVTFFSAAMAMRKVIKMSPVEAAKYTEQVTESKKKESRALNGGNAAHMAWKIFSAFASDSLSPYCHYFWGLPFLLAQWFFLREPIKPIGLIMRMLISASYPI